MSAGEKRRRVYPGVVGLYSDAAWARADLFTDGAITDAILTSCEAQVEQGAELAGKQRPMPAGVPRKGERIFCGGIGEHHVMTCVQDIDLALPLNLADFELPDGSPVPADFGPLCRICGAPWQVTLGSGQRVCVNIQGPEA